MNNDYWNSLKENYTDNVLEITNQDLSGVLLKEIELLSGKATTAADLGCGPGSLLKLLAPRFQSVYAVDFAQALLDQAQQEYPFSNITFIQHNLAGTKPLKFKVDAAFCINAMINPSYEKRFKMATNVKNAIKTKGVAIFVVPAFESIFNTYKALIRCEQTTPNIRARTVHNLEKLYSKEVISPIEGIVDIGGTPTKTYTREGLMTFLEEVGLKVKRIEKVEYRWEEELDNPPLELRAPYPWDWLAITTQNTKN